jgi:hypothetical protein
MMHYIRSLVACTLILVFPVIGAAGNLQTLFDVDLKNVIKQNSVDHSTDPHVLALRFSPNGKRLAVVVDRYLSDGVYKSRLLIIQVESPKSVLAHYEIEAGIDEGEVGYRGPGFEWSPSGDIINAAGTIINLRDGTRCHIPHFGGLIGEHVAVTVEPPVPFAKERTRINLFDESCHNIGTWGIADKWFLQDISQDRSVILVVREGGDSSLREFLVVDPMSQTIVHHWPADAVHGQQFADRGEAICSGSGVTSGGRIPVECFEVETGKKIGEAPTINGGLPMAVATKASRIVASDYRRRLSLITDDLFTAALQRRVVWDFRSGKEIVSWHPSSQTYRLRSPDGQAKIVKEPARFAISPDGNRIAEAGNATLHLYQIEP